MEEREGEKHQCVVASHTPPPGDLTPQPRHVPWLGIKLATLWFAGWHSIHWATPARASDFFLIFTISPERKFFKVYSLIAYYKRYNLQWLIICLFSPLSFVPGTLPEAPDLGNHVSRILRLCLVFRQVMKQKDLGSGIRTRFELWFAYEIGNVGQVVSFF